MRVSKRDRPQGDTLTLGAPGIAPAPQSEEAAHDAHHDAHPEYLHHHFDDIDQQREATTLGMWTFLATEILMFGGLFFAYTLYRWSFHDAFVIGSHHLDWKMGAINTGVLLVSSLTMAMAVHAAATKSKGKLIGYLILTLILGTAFLVIKYFEWSHDFHIGLVPSLAWNYFDINPGEAMGVPVNQIMMYFVIYFCMTGLHAIHMIVGLAMLTIFIVHAARGKFTNGNDQPVEIAGLYWHLIDIVWVFLYPLLYLIGGIAHGAGH